MPGWQTAKSLLSLIGLLVAGVGQAALGAEASDATGVEFFETRVRPVLAEHCYRCHGPDKQEGNLRLDQPGGIQPGGDRGTAILPGEPDKSLLIQAVRYTDQDFQMPPKGRLPKRLIEDLVQWVRIGAPVPAKTVAASATRSTPGFDLSERLEHWSYQAVTRPALPAVRDADWPISPIDRFILAKLEAASLAPAEEADRRTLIRRVTFDLIGLPPTIEEVEAFVADSTEGAFARVVDRLLASPHYGERWGRHWLDLVRYAETLGHEFDYELFHAWRYRDYVVRAFNADVPYNKFVLEHVAGDLLTEPRRHPTEGFNESVMGTGFWWLGEGKHSPVDVRQEQTDRIDNQIDVFGKAFLAQTIACARCHDHKFDAITAADYYALVGYLKSTRYEQAAIDAPHQIAEPAAELARLSEKITAATRTVLLEQARRAAVTDNPERERMIAALAAAKNAEACQPLYAWHKLAGQENGMEEPLAERARRLRTELLRQRDERVDALRQTRLYEDFDSADFGGWLATGEAFAGGPTQPGSLAVEQADGRGGNCCLPPGCAHSGVLSLRLEGALRSPTFTIEQPFVHLRIAGRASRVNLVIDGFTLIRNPIYGGLSVTPNSESLAWHTIDVSMWQGHQAYLELLDCSVPNLTQTLSEEVRQGKPVDGYLVVDEVRFSPHRSPPLEIPSSVGLQVLADPLPTSLDELAGRYITCAADYLAARHGRASKVTAADAAELVRVLIDHGGLNPAATPKETELATSRARYGEVEASMPAPRYVLAATDGNGQDEALLHRGNYRTPGETVPRRLPPSVCRMEQPAHGDGSGRLEMALRLVDPANPLLARVIVNRLWQHHFGQGIVRSPDDFGRMGDLPTHPELLDYLASELVERGWSLKEMHRLMLVSRSYQMSSHVNAAASEADPENQLLHRMNVRRLDAEAIRDALLSVSGQMNPRLFGPSVMPHLTPFMEGRGRPAVSGPLDGNRRRSLYINVRRNFLTPMLLAFDYPIPFSTMGRRSVSNVPAQALAMMNGPFVAEQARQWAAAACSDASLTPGERVQWLYQTAYARPASPQELTAALRFVDQQAASAGGDSREAARWTELCHVLMNLKEFIFLD